MLQYLTSNFIKPLDGFENYEDFAWACRNGAVIEDLQFSYNPTIKLHFPNKEIVYRCGIIFGDVPLTVEDAKELVSAIKKEKEPFIAFVATYKSGANITVVCAEKNSKNAIVIVDDPANKRSVLSEKDFSELNQVFKPLINELVSPSSRTTVKTVSPSPNTMKKENPPKPGTANKIKNPSLHGKQAETVSSNSFISKIKKFFNS